MSVDGEIPAGQDGGDPLAIDREQFAGFHHYLFTEKPSYRDANQKAAQWIGAQEIQQALQSPVPGNYIAKHVALYQKAGAGTIPKLMFPETTVVGAIESEASMTSLIEQHLSKPSLRN